MMVLLLEKGMRMRKGPEGVKVLIWGLIIGFVEASAFISLGFWRWAWDVTTLGA
jgi:hypothetical protein